MASELYRLERTCEECGNSFWGGAAALYCSAACRQRGYRARKRGLGLHSAELEKLCRAVTEKPQILVDAPSKLLPALFRATARELRKRGWDPIELLMDMPDDAVSADDRAPGGFEGEAPERRRWLFPPEAEIKKLDERIAERAQAGEGTQWYRTRRAQLARLLAGRSAKAPALTARER